MQDQVSKDRDKRLSLHRPKVLTLTQREVVDGGGLVLEGADNGLVQQRFLDVRRDLTL